MGHFATFLTRKWNQLAVMEKRYKLEDLPDYQNFAQIGDGTYNDYLASLRIVLRDFKEFDNKTVDTSILVTRVESAMRLPVKNIALALGYNVSLKSYKRNARDHFLNQLLNLINEQQYFNYVELKQLGANGEIPADIRQEVVNAKNPDDYKRVSRWVRQFIENEDRYRTKKLSQEVYEKIDLIHLSKEKDEVKKNRFLTAMNEYDADNALVIRENPKSTPIGVKPDRLAELQKDPDYGEIVALIKDPNWRELDDKELEEIWKLAKDELAEDRRLAKIKRDAAAEQKRLNDIANQQKAAEQVKKQPPPIVPQTPTTTPQTNNLQEKINELEKRLREANDQISDLQNIANANAQSVLRAEEKRKEFEDKYTKFVSDGSTKEKQLRQQAIDNLTLAQRYQKEKGVVEGELGQALTEIKTKDDIIRKLKEEVSNAIPVSQKTELEKKVIDLIKQIDTLKVSDTDEKVKKLNEIIEDLTEENHQIQIELERKFHEYREKLEDKYSEQTSELAIYTKLKRVRLLPQNKIDKSADDLKIPSVAGLWSFVLVEEDSLNITLQRLNALNSLSYQDEDGNVYILRNYQNFPKTTLYELTDPVIIEKMEELLEEQKALGSKGEFLDLNQELQLAMLGESFDNAYRGSDRLKLTFLVDNVVQSSVTISDLALYGSSYDGSKYYAIPMDDPESYNKVYHHFSSFGKNVIEPEGVLVVEKDGYEPLKTNFRIDYASLKGDLYHGRKLVFGHDNATLFTKFMSRKHHTIEKIIINQDAFQRKGAYGMGTKMEEGDGDGEGVGEVYEVPIYPVSSAQVTTDEEGEGEWPSDF